MKRGRQRWLEFLLVIIWVWLQVAPAFAADTIEEWDPGITDWEYYFFYDGSTADKLSQFVIGAGTGVGETLSIGLVGALDHNDTEAGALTSLGMTAFYRFPSMSRRYGVNLDILADFVWQEMGPVFELHRPPGGEEPFFIVVTEDTYVWDIGVEVSYPTRFVTPYGRAFVLDNFADDLVSAHFTIADLFTVIPARMELLVEWDIEKTQHAEAEHSIGVGLNTRFWFWQTGGNEHDVELIPEVRYFFDNDGLDEGFWALTVGLILTW